MVSASDIDTAATEFDRRFHISVDETEDQGNQVCELFKFKYHLVLTVRTEMTFSNDMTHIYYCIFFKNSFKFGSGNAK